MKVNLLSTNLTPSQQCDLRDLSVLAQGMNVTRRRLHRACATASGLTDVDELMVALGCRFALDVFTIDQQDRLLADLDPLTHDPVHALWR